MPKAGFTLVTNNSLARDLCCETCWVEGGIEEVLSQVLTLVLAGHRLLTHPLSGSVKPGVNPYKSVLVSRRAGNVCWEEVAVIQGCLDKVREMRKNKPSVTWSPKVDEDLKVIDLDLILSGINSLHNLGC